MYKLTCLSVAFFALVSCSWFGKGPGGGNSLSPDGPVLQKCDDVVTSEKVAAYHQSQTQFRVEPYGWDVSCQAFVEVNGRRTEVVRKGKSGFRVFPKLKYVSMKREAENGAYLVTTELTPLTETDVKSIFQGLGVKESEDSPLLDYSNGTSRSPSYVRFERGALFYVSSALPINSRDGKNLRLLKIEAESSERRGLDEKMIAFQNGEVDLEWLWSPRSGRSLRIVNSSMASSIEWSDLEGVTILASMVREGALTETSSAKSRAISYAIWWDVDIKEVHREVPELFTHAETTWQDSTIADNTVRALVDALRYSVKVSPSDPKSSILSAYEGIGKFVYSSAEALRIAVDHVTNSRWSETHFNQLKVTAEILYPAYGNQSWPLSLEINDRVGFDAVRSQFMAKVGAMMRKKGLFSNQDPKANADAIEVKIAAGINSENIDLYFDVLEIISTNFSVNVVTASLSADRWVLGGRINLGNKSVCLDFLRWLDQDAYVGFVEASDIFDSLSVRSDFSQSVTSFFKAVFSWLSNEAYLSRGDAVTKTSTYFKNESFSEAQFSSLKSYYSWLISSLYLSRQQALTKAEAAVVETSLPESQIHAIQQLTDWYINTIYLSRSESFKRAEDLVLVKKISAEQCALLKSVVNWLIESMYLNKAEASSKGEGYVLSMKPLTLDKFNQLKGLVSWYMDSMYLNRSEALAKSEELVLSKDLSKAQTDVVISSGNWLVSVVYANRSESIQKSYSYVVEHFMDANKFARLKAEFDAAIARGVNRSEALKVAEKSVLGM